MKVDTGKFNHAIIALWVGDFSRSRDFLEYFSESVRELLPFNIEKLTSLLRRRTPRESEEDRTSEFAQYKDELFIYGPLLIRAENILGKISKVDLESIEKDTTLTMTEHFSFRVSEIGINLFELKGYIHNYPPTKIGLVDLEAKLQKRFQLQECKIYMIDRNKKESLDSLTFELIKQQPFTYAHLHVIKMGIIYGEIHTSNKRNADSVSLTLFEGLEKARL